MDEFPEHFWYFLVPTLIVFIAPMVIGRDGRERIASRFTNLPWVMAIRSRRRSKHPIFGERVRMRRPISASTPEFVLTPKFARLPPFLRALLQTVWLIVVEIPYLIYFAIKEMYLYLLYHQDYLSSQLDDRADGDPRARTLFRHAASGRRSAIGGKKGGLSPERPAATADRDNKIRAEAKKMMSTGKKFRDLASIFETRYSNDPDYPNSKTQYRNILRPLKDELEIK